MLAPETEDEKWRKTLTHQQYAAIFGPRTSFEPGGYSFAINMLMNKALYGGVINKPKDAVAYARVLMEPNTLLAKIPASALHAEESAKIWHITTVAPGRADRVEVLSFSRENGKILSGDL